MTDVDDIERLLAEARKLPYGPGKTALCEEAVRVADTRGDPGRGFDARIALTEAAQFGGQPDLMLVAFAWVLATFDQEPRLRTPQRTSDVLWRYKWVVGELPSWPQYSRETVEEMFADMRRRFEGYGGNAHAVHHKERGLGMRLGDKAMAAAGHRKYRRTARGPLSDCRACTVDTDAGYHFFRGRYAEGMAALDPILAGRLRCGTVPHRTYGNVLLPLWKLGRLDEASRYHRLGLPMVSGTSNSLGTVVDHVEFLALTLNLAKAVRLAERHLPAVLSYPTPSMRRVWFTTLRLLFGLVARSGQKSVTVRLPADHPLKTADDRHPPAALFDWFDREARLLAAAFDARNGSAGCTRQIDKQVRLMARAKPYPVTGR